MASQTNVRGFEPFRSLSLDLRCQAESRAGRQRPSRLPGGQLQLLRKARRQHIQAEATGFAELHELYDGTTVPQHRYLASFLTAAVPSREIALEPAKWFAGIADVDFSSVAEAWLNTKSNTEYEQLKRIELDPDASQLSAVLTVKQRASVIAAGT